MQSIRHVLGTLPSNNEGVYELYHVPMCTHGKIQCYHGKIHFINCNLKHFNDKIVFKIIIITHTGNPGLKFWQKSPMLNWYYIWIMKKTKVNKKEAVIGSWLNLNCWNTNQVQYRTEGDDSVTRSGDFWKFLVTLFLSKVAQTHGEFLG